MEIVDNDNDDDYKTDKMADEALFQSHYIFTSQTPRFVQYKCKLSMKIARGVERNPISFI